MRDCHGLEDENQTAHAAALREGEVGPEVDHVASHLEEELAAFRWAFHELDFERALGACLADLLDASSAYEPCEERRGRKVTSYLSPDEP